MGKKNKKLKKKKAPAINQSYVEAAQVSSSAPIAQAETAAVVAQPKAAQVAPPEFQYVRRDVKKILLLLLLIVIFMFMLYYLDQKTTLLVSVSNWAYRILNIQAL